MSPLHNHLSINPTVSNVLSSLKVVVARVVIFSELSENIRGQLTAIVSDVKGNLIRG